jgi:hypothetical protein
MRICVTPVAIVGLILLAWTWRSSQAQWTKPENVPPTLSIIWEVVATPHPSTAKAADGVIELNVWIEDKKLADSRFTGGGCIIGAFGPAAVSWSTDSDGHHFTAVCRARDPNDRESFVEWRGVLRESKISGDILVRVPGPKLTEKEIDAMLQKERAEIERTLMVVSHNGTVLNQAQVHQTIAKLDRDRFWMAARGETVRLTFESHRTLIGPSGAWPRTPTTQPSR